MKLIDERIRNNKLQGKKITAEEAAGMIENGMIVATSGFTPAGYPKAVPLALAKRIKKSKEKLQISLMTGASVGEELDGALTEAGIIARRYPYQTNKLLRDGINSGKIAYTDIHLSHFAQQVRYDFFGEIDLVIIEAIVIDEEGNIIPSTSVGVSPTFIDQAKAIIVEINNGQPLELEGIHDIYQPQDPPNRYPIPLIKPGDRIGTPYIPNDQKKIQAIVITDSKDQASPLAPIDKNGEKIASHIVDFFKTEVKRNRLPQNLLPLQSGVGSVANAVLAGLLDSPFENLDFYSEVIQDSVLDLIDSGKIRIASGTSLTFSKEGQQRFINNLEEYKRKIILRPQEISNNPEIIRRLGSIINNCTHPEYKSKLKNYYQRALRKGGHMPHLIEKALSWHKKFLETGSMK